MNAADIRELTEQAERDRQTEVEEAKAAADAWWLATGIPRVEECVQNAAKAGRNYHKHQCKHCPDFVVEHFKDLGFEAFVTKTATHRFYGDWTLVIRW
jgi:hypothetical protein